MSNAALSWAWGIRGISPIEKLVLVRLADRAKPDGTAHPGQTSLAADTGLDPRSVRNVVKRLKAAGLLVIDADPTPTRSTRYRLALPPGQPPPPPERDSGPERHSGGEGGAGGTGTAFPRGEERDSGGVRNGVPVNPNTTQREPSENPHPAGAVGSDSRQNGEPVGAPQEPSGLLPGIDTLAGNQNALATPPRAKSKPTRKRNELLDALLVATGTNPTKATRQEIKRAADALAGIREGCPEVTAEEIHRRAANCKELWQKPSALTPHSLASNWSKFENGDPRREAARLREAIERHPANTGSVYHDPNATAEMKADLAEKRRQLLALTSREATRE